MTASAGRRLGAFGIDYAVIFAYLAILGLLGASLSLGPTADWWRRWMSDPIRADVVALLTTVLPVGLYFALSEASARGATLGKRRLGLRVVGPEDGRIGVGRSVVRTGLKLLPWQLAHTAMFHIPGFPMDPGPPPAWTTVLLVCMWTLVAVYVVGLTRLGDGRPLYDRVAGTRCVGP